MQITKMILIAFLLVASCSSTPKYERKLRVEKPPVVKKEQPAPKPEAKKEQPKTVYIIQITHEDPTSVILQSVEDSEETTDSDFFLARVLSLSKAKITFKNIEKETEEIISSPFAINGATLKISTTGGLQAEDFKAEKKTTGCEISVFKKVERFDFFFRDKEVWHRVEIYPDGKKEQVQRENPQPQIEEVEGDKKRKMVDIEGDTPMEDEKLTPLPPLEDLPVDEEIK